METKETATKPIPSGAETSQVKEIQSKNMIFEMKKLFTGLLLSNKKYVDPSELLDKILDNSGKKVGVGN